MTPKERFDKKVVRAEDNECWEWVGAKKPTGYGNFYIDGRYLGAHVASWEIENGRVPEGNFVCHKCDNPSCVNPAHLFLGTPLDNMRDMRAKGRAKGIHEGGEKHPVAKLTKISVEKIRELRDSGLILKTIAEMFGVSESNIHYVCSNKTWAIDRDIV